MQNASDETRFPKQWTVRSILIKAPSPTTWGLDRSLVPGALAILHNNGLIDKMPQDLDLPFEYFEKLVALLHKKGYKTDNLNEAISRALEDGAREPVRKFVF